MKYKRVIVREREEGRRGRGGGKRGREEITKGEREWWGVRERDIGKKRETERD